MTTKIENVNNEVITKDLPKPNNQLQKGNTIKPTEKEEKLALDAMIEKFAPTIKPTAEERIVRKEHFEAHCTRFKLLKQKSNDLKLFIAGNDKTNAKIVLKNASGFEFDVRNSNVIDKVLATMEAELNILLSESETEVLNFEI